MSQLERYRRLILIGQAFWCFVFAFVLSIVLSQSSLAVVTQTLWSITARNGQAPSPAPVPAASAEAGRSNLPAPAAP
ncbi:MAG: hypothetical protein GX442_15665 [Candidatus Riflebacteria bacterium]|nr:hypothetical protein [Candidatus Riflebacteria bacterium]